MYKKVIEDIKRNLGPNNDLNRKYLISQIDIYKTHENSTEIVKEISRMIWECLTPEEQEEFVRIIEEENPINAQSRSGQGQQQAVFPDGRKVGPLLFQ